ncbi:hypothetical protein Bca52824_018252 [Brassica carinata]|uniref:Uncharacterized protein n=1 Tax=Brassica carinata TaxID=52824 RepID=A0A8X8AX85_BRACI|nr:hypothetical protein Bca52824_018252 [Brassica carinata]
MGNNNATANLTEEESTKLETNGMSPLENVPVETTQDQVFLVGEGKDGDKQRESFSDGVTGKETPETEPQSKELDKDPQVTKVEEDMSRNGLVTETDEQLHKNTSVGEGVETVCEPTKWEEFNETAGTEEKLVMNESLEETAPAGNVVRLDQEICMEQRTWFPEIEPQEILNLDSGVLDDEVINEGKADKEISEPGDSPVQGLVSEVAYPSRNKTGFDKAKTSDILPVSCQTSNKGQETTKAINESSKEAKLEMRSPALKKPLLSQDKTEKYKATLDVEEEAVMLKRSETEKIRGFELSLGLSMNLSGRCDADDSFKETESSEDNLLEEKRNMSETLLVSCVGSKKAEDTNDVISERNKGDVLEMRSPSSGNDLRTKERSGKSTEETSLLSQDKTEAYNSTPNVEEKTVMLKRSETEKLRGFELSLGLSMNLSGRCDGDGSFKEINSSEDNLGDKEANTSETLFVSCVGSSSSKAQEASLLCQDKTETYEATIDVEKKTVMLKRSESEETRGFELSRELSMKPGERSEADDSLKENKDSGDNLLDKKASWGSMRGRVRKRSKSSLFGTCLCCNIAMN